MEAIKNRIRDLAAAFLPEITAIRRHLHQHPELSKEEFKTAGFICSMLDEYGISYKRNIAGTGILAMITGAGTGRCIALRADMDALPVTEENDVPYKSSEPGKMHACGHDAHMACLLGAAKILNEIKQDFKGTIKLIFQPSEETYPGGAIGMIREGILHDPEVELVIAQHVINNLNAGTVGLKPGAYMASTDEIFLTVRGKGGHAATPEQVVDPILIASHIIVALQQIVSRNAVPTMPTVLSFGKIEGKGRTNIIPDVVTVEGTMRTYNEDWRKKIQETIAKMASSIAEGMGGSCETRIAHGYPYLHNNEILAGKLKVLAAEYLGQNNVLDLEARMTAEDFAYYCLEVPSCMYRLGIRNEEKNISSNLHTATFDIDESSLGTGTGLMAFLAVSQLAEL
ncbi:MAG: M20 metallopeptidase family protein [Syntrophothermus sp.]